MRFYNTIDEKGRFIGLKIDCNANGEQRDSHGISYVGARAMLSQIGEPMGLDRLVMKDAADLQIEFAKGQYEKAIQKNVLPQTTTFRDYLSNIYLRPGSILPALFRYRLQRGLIE